MSEEVKSNRETPSSRVMSRGSTGRMSSRAQTPEERERRRKEKEAQLRKEAQEEFNTNWIAPKGRPIDKIRKLQYKGGTLFSPIKTKGEQQWETGSKVAGPNLTVKGMEVLVKAIRDGMDDTQTQLEGWEAVKTACSYIGKATRGKKLPPALTLTALTNTLGACVGMLRCGRIARIP